MNDATHDNTALAITGKPLATDPGAANGKSGIPQLPEHWAAFQLLSCRLSLEIPVPGFTVGALLRLGASEVIDTRWLQGTDVPLRVNGKFIGWAEFEVIDDRLAARLTQIA